MTVVYNPIPFVKLIQKFFHGNYEPIIMGICGKIFIIYLHNLPCCSCCELNIHFQNIYPSSTNMKPPSGRLPGDGSAQARKHGRHS